MAENSVIEQLRLQEGRLFQNEKTLALYLDVKAVVFEAIVAATRSEDREQAFRLLTSVDEENDKIIGAFLGLAPSGMREYHAKTLHDCVKIVANLLWPSEILLVARPKVTSLLSGVLRRLATQTTVTSGQFLELDPIKQDFLIREAFRRCLVNDCLVVFEDEIKEDSKEVDLEGEVGPDDSASHIGSVADERPSGARSTLNGGRSVLPSSQVPALPVLDETKSVCDDSKIDDTRSVAKSATGPAKSVIGSAIGPAKSVIGSAIGPAKSAVSDDSRSFVGSVAPRVITVNGDSNSVSSKVSGTTATSIMRRALNVRKVHIEPDAQ